MNSIPQNYISSIEVAEMVGKDHRHLLGDIRRYCEQLGETKIGLSDFFETSTYQSEQGKELPCYLVTEKGCEFIAHKLTGVKGTAFTAKYINKFHEMKNRLEVPQTAAGQIQLLAQGHVELEQKVDAIKTDIDDFKHDIPLFAVECDQVSHAVRVKGIETLGGKNAAAYINSTIRGKVYSDIHREIDRQFDVTTYKAIKRRQLEKAIEIIRGYVAPVALKEQIDMENAQMTF